MTPGEHVKAELERRAWAQVDLAFIIGCPPRLVSEVINGRRAITARTAKLLGTAFDQDPAIWLNRQYAFDLSRAKPADPKIAQRVARLQRRQVERAYLLVMCAALAGNTTGRVE